MSCLNAAEPNRLAADRSIGARTITLTTAHLGGAHQHEPNQNTSVTARKYPDLVAVTGIKLRAPQKTKLSHT